MLRQGEEIQSTVEDDDADDDDEDEVGQEDEHAGDLADLADRPGLDLLPPDIGLTSSLTRAGLNRPLPLLVQGHLLHWPQKRRWRDPGTKMCGRTER